MKKFWLIVLWIFLPMIYWCWSSDTMQIEFEKYNLQIWNTFKVVDSALVENKQIKDKILKAYKITNKDWFDENLIVSKTTINQNIDSDTYARLNIERLWSKLTWYKSISQDSYSFSCWSDTISWRYVNYKLSDNVVDDSSKDYYITQYFFKNWTNWYILSFAWSQSDSNEKYVDYIKTIACK